MSNSNSSDPRIAPVYFKEAEAALYLGASLSTLRRWRRSSIGPDYFRVGDVLRYTQQALDEFRERRTSKAA